MKEYCQIWQHQFSEAISCKVMLITLTIFLLWSRKYKIIYYAQILVHVIFFFFFQSKIVTIE